MQEFLTCTEDCHCKCSSLPRLDSTLLGAMSQIRRTVFAAHVAVQWPVFHEFIQLISEMHVTRAQAYGDRQAGNCFFSSVVTGRSMAPVQATQQPRRRAARAGIVAMLVGVLGLVYLRPVVASLSGTSRRGKLAFFGAGFSALRRQHRLTKVTGLTPTTGAALVQTQAAAVIVAAEEAKNNSLPKKLMDIYTLTEKEIEDFLQTQLKQPRYRAKQVYAWLYQRGATSFEVMNDLPKALRAGLAEHFSLGCLEMAFEQVSKDGTIKRAYRLADGQLIESVLMPYEDGRRTACISSQAGCAMGCAFCQTGQMGFARQLTDAEIFQQALFFSRDLAKEGLYRLSNVVFMGEGEPLNNRKMVFSAVRRLNSDLKIGARHITVSTVGLAPRIRDLADTVDDLQGEGGLLSQIKLAVSLHATTDRERTAIMPVNKRFPVADLMSACQYYVQRTNRRISFEWALISGQNDSPKVADELGQLLAPLKGKCHVNVINVNPTTGFDGKPGGKASMERFLNILNEDWGIPATMRVRRKVYARFKPGSYSLPFLFVLVPYLRGFVFREICRNNLNEDWGGSGDQEGEEEERDFLGSIFPFLYMTFLASLSFTSLLRRPVIFVGYFSWPP